MSKFIKVDAFTVDKISFALAAAIIEQGGSVHVRHQKRWESSLRYRDARAKVRVTVPAGTTFYKPHPTSYYKLVTLPDGRQFHWHPVGGAVTCIRLVGEDTKAPSIGWEYLPSAW